ncbi:hypothetical protein ABB37_09271 [Leptomonas pyrrhocoris]|uniref:Uncharacterized protein n=1 Tax=Leptomonas pyrrhocoris TaxID=157538 RepID=A0A0M9FR18_LEPPY|nr:hypothetical protein ABB37_09271 [Leptomonas pyrrhocoris]KPA74267.1 hypothetical protein ABB37_09271 [Leptomonas pyrrhocoris]|eukprot:XP_015652706.1 hypothetical protein ABB37_09271 [Leptomonas pyrrhocoris]
MDLVCRSCGAPACIVVSAQRAHSTQLGDAAASAAVTSDDEQPPLARFCVHCGCAMHLTLSPLSDSGGTKPPKWNARETEFGQGRSSSSSLFLPFYEDAEQTSPAVPLSVVHTVARALACAHLRERRFLVRELARLRAEASSTQPVLPPSFSPCCRSASSAAAVPLRGSARLSEGARVADEREPRRGKVAVAPPQSGASSTDRGPQRSPTDLGKARPPAPQQCRAGSGRCSSSHDWSRSRSPSVVIPPSDRSTAGNAALLLPPPPPRCSQTLPRHSRSYDSDVAVPVSVPAGSKATDAQCGPLVFVDGDLPTAARPFFPSPLPCGVVLDAEEKAQQQEQRLAYERLRDALLQQL